MQFELERELAGSAQLVKSARIWFCELPLGAEQRDLSDATNASLWAKLAFIAVSVSTQTHEIPTMYLRRSRRTVAVQHCP